MLLASGGRERDGESELHFFALCSFRGGVIWLYLGTLSRKLFGESA